MIMSAGHNNPGFMRTALISLLIIISQQISSCSGQDVCVRLENWVIQVPEGNTTGQVLKSVNVTTTVAHSLDLTLENAGPDVLSLVEQDNNLKIVVNTNLDAENASRPNIQYQLTCTSIGRPLHYQLKLVVVDENDNYPVFNERLKTSLNESLSVGSEVYRLENKATDADITENAITYSITAQDPLYNNTFEISGLSSIGSVILKSPLDYDSGQRQYLLVVTASDNQKSSTATLTINVEDVDDQNPVFNNTGRYIWNVEENTTQTFFQVSAYDPDTGVLPKPMIKYNLITDYGMFSINESTGIITPSRPLDREQNQTLYLFVQAYQDDKPSFRVASKLLEVKVEDVNDNPPVMSPLSYTKSLSENTASGVVVLQVSGSDADQGVNAQFHYHINRTDQINNAFIINPTTGEITVNDSNVLDAEKTEEFNFKVFAREVNTVEKRESQEASVRITLLDMNDNSPLFNKSHYEFTINETLPVGSFIGRVFATDADSKDYGDIVYNLENSASSLPFKVDRVTGNLTVHGNISVGTFTLYVTASDQPQTTAPRRSTVQVKIQVLDVNNHKPRFTSLQRTFNVTEGTENYLLTYLLVKDEDSIDNLHCDLLAGDGTKFDVRFSDDIAGCSVKVIGDIDREATPEYNLTVQVSDGLHNDTAVLSVRVIDANDNSPIFTLPVFDFSVTEGIYAGLLVGKVQATDADVGVNGQIKYTLENVLQGWTIEEDSGNISFTGKLDAENQQILQLLVKAADSGQQSLINVTRVLITVSDVNDNSPVCYPESVNLWMKENTPKKLLYDAGAICSDADVALENRETVFRIASGNESLFGVSEDGRLFTKKTLLLDSNSLTGYNITLEVYNIRAYSNDSLRNATLHVYLRLVDVNNEAPVFTKSEYRFSVDENSPVDSIVGSVIATDGDSSAENSAIFYTITGGNTQGFFKMNSESGQITVNTSFDYEQLVSKNFSLQVQAVNGDPSATPGRSGSADVIITILDINDATPMFSKNIYNWKINERQTESNLSVTATDADSEDTQLSYRFLYNTSVPFEIDHDTGLVHLTRALDYESKQSYDILVIAVDKGQPELTGSATIHVMVQNLNEAPVFLTSSYDFSVRESEAVNTYVGWLSVMDIDGDYINITIIPSSIKFHVSPLERLNEVNSTVCCSNKRGAHYHRSEEGLFSVCENNSLPCVCVNQPLDYENRTEYHLLLQASDNGSPPREGYAEVRILVEDSNDVPPQFSQPLYTASISEGQGPISILMVSASDTDSPVLNYSVVSSSYGNSADFEFIGRQLVSQAGIDREDAQLMSEGTMQLNVSVSDGVHFTYALVNLSVTDINDNTPSFVGDLQKTIPRNLPKGSEVIKVRVEDYDPTNEGFTFWLYDSMGIFAINRSSGVISLTKSPSSSESFEFDLTVFVSDHGTPPLINQTTVYINISESNRFRPVFNQQEYTFHIKENKLGKVGEVNATDEDGPDSGEGMVQYRIVGQKQDRFKVNATTGEIYILVPLNREEQCQYHLNIEAYDQGANSRFTKVNVTVDIDNVNDNHPEFDNTSSSHTVASNAVNLNVFKVSASDADCVPECGHADCALTYTLASTNVTSEEGNITIDQAGQVTVQFLKNSTIGKSIVLNITVSDGLTTVSKMFTMFVYSPSELPKADSPGTITVWENGPQDLNATQFITDINATIGSRGYDQCLQYSISQISGLHQRYAVNSSTGVVTSTYLDYEQSSHDIISIDVLAMIDCDAVPPTPNPLNKTSVQVNVIVQDLDDCAPKFEKSTYSLDLSEGTPLGSTVEAVTASDCDGKEDYKTFTYSIDPASNENGTFAINSSGHVTLQKRLSVQTTSEYNLILLATGVHNTTFIGKATLRVRVLDINDNDPRFLQNVYHFSVSEDPGVNRHVGLVNATDPDQGANGQLSYSLTYQSANGTFRITQGGEILTASALDREKIDHYIMIITAEDHGAPSRKGTCEVIVDVTDVNDNSPQLKDDTYWGTVPENVMDGRVIRVDPPIFVTDKDVGVFGQESVVLQLKGQGSDIFEVYNRSIHVKKMNDSLLDRENMPMYNFTLVAIDENGKGRNSTAHLLIKITDVNDVEPHFDRGHYQFNVSENSGGRVVGNVTASDEDTTGFIRYHITSGGDGRFYINPQTGELRVLDGLDREAKEHYVLNVTASDGVFEPSTVVSITVLDENDNSPYFSPQLYHMEVTEEERGGTVVGQVTAQDHDLGLNGQLIFTLLNNEDNFTVNSSSGVISTARRLDREQQDVYSVSVMVMDRGIPSLNSSIVLTVTLLDINDNSPRFLPQNITKLKASILEKTPVDSVISWPRAEDPDKGDNAVLTYSLSGPGYEYFKIDRDTGLVTVRDRIDLNTLLSKGYVLNETNATLMLNVSASDGGMPPRQTSIPLQIDVEGISDLAPQFSRTTYRFTVPEGQGPDVTVGYLELHISTLNSTAVAPQPHYNIEDTPGANTHFVVKHLNSSQQNEGSWMYGSVLKTTANPMDYETETEYILIIRAGDGKVPERSAYAVVKVSVEDVNDNSPVCPSQPLSFSVAENESDQLDIGQVVASDQDSGDNGLLMYTLVDNTIAEFEIDPRSGSLLAVMPLDRELESEYSLTILVQDNGTSPRNCSVAVSVTVNDVNDNSPVFYSPGKGNDTDVYEASVLENAIPGTLVFQMYANDTDAGLNGTVFYSLNSTSVNNFFIHPNDGKLFTLGNLDFETVSSFNLTVLAYDVGIPQQSSEAMVLITVLDVEDTTVIQPLYEFYISGITQLHSVIGIIKSTEKLHFNITAGNAEDTFSVDPDNGEITLLKPPGVRSTPFNLTIMATNHKSPPKALFTSVLIHIENTVLTVVHLENQEPYQLVVDINTTEELAGQPVTYTFVDFSYPDLFNISSSTGKIYVLQQLDREEVSEYVLLVHGQVTHKSSRRKRAFGDNPGDIRVVIDVGDENDNAPKFNTNKLTFGLPRSSSFNYLIATLTATDLDEGNNSAIFYSLSQGDTNTLNIDTLSGELRCVRDLAKTLINQLSVVVNATDNMGQGHSVQVAVTVAVVSDSDRAILVVGHPVRAVKDFVPDIQGNLSAILAYNVQVESVEPHIAHSETGSKLNPEMSDIYIHAIDPKTGEVVSQDALLRRLAEKTDEIEEFFSRFKIKELTRLTVSHDAYTMSLSEIALLCLAAVIFVGSILSIGVVIYSSRQYEFEKLRSQQANNARAKASELVNNPAYTQTVENQFDNDSAEPLELHDMSSEMKKMVLYESQELTMDLFSETSDYVEEADSSVSGDGQPLGGPIDVVVQEALSGPPFAERGQPVGDSGNVTEVEAHSDKNSNSSDQLGPKPPTSFGVIDQAFIFEDNNSSFPSKSEVHTRKSDHELSPLGKTSPKAPSRNSSVKGTVDGEENIDAVGDLKPLSIVRGHNLRGHNDEVTRL
ncbi:protocadherin Fat 4-like [Liolophura sinensis]|uniref:protocadherin Fat 4-like n=1 Tax=Liolophura sinensis TaxID=3198878 RepID=UPI00315841E1